MLSIFSNKEINSIITVFRLVLPSKFVKFGLGFLCINRAAQISGLSS